MRATVIQITSLLLFLVTSISFASDLTKFEKTCSEIGFKKKTTSYGDCVIELFDRENTQQKVSAQEEQNRNEAEAKKRAAELAAKGDGSSEHQLCFRYGFIPGSTNYAECRQRIDAAKAEARAAEARYEADLRRYEEQLARAERQRDSDRNTRLMEMGLGMMSGGGRSSSSTSNIGPAPTPPLLTQRIRLPDGQIINCRPGTGGTTIDFYCN
jgi:hypothetical protein